MSAGDWIEWGGGLCPVPSHALVEVRFRRIIPNKVRKAGKFSWNRFGDEKMLTDVVAYRLVASAGEAGTATTPKSGVVHEHAAPSGETPHA